MTVKICMRIIYIMLFNVLEYKLLRKYRKSNILTLKFNKVKIDIAMFKCKYLKNYKAKITKILRTNVAI